MTAIVDHFTTTLTVKRMVWTTDGSGNEYSEEQTVASITGHVQQSTSQLAESLGLRFTKTFSIWCDLDADVTEGDTLTDGTYIYTVKAKQTFENGANKHTELVCERV